MNARIMEPGSIKLQIRLARSPTRGAPFALDLNVALPGSRVSAIFGPSGSGKTTCLRTIAGLERATRAYIEVNGEVWQDDARGVFIPTHQRGVGYVFQNAALFSHLSVEKNIHYGFARVPDQQQRINVAEVVELLGLTPLLDRRTDTLSGGERQRVAIARALAANPKLMLMDEPLASLDTRRKADILPYLEQLRDHFHVPMIYVSHAVDEVARLADHLVVLDAGQVIASGPPADLMSRLDLPLAQGDTAGAVLHATIDGHDPDYHLSLVKFRGGKLWVPQQALAKGGEVRIRVQARDVSLTLEAQSGSSILNIVPVVVTEFMPDGPAQVMVRLDAGGTPLLARITRKSADALDLRAAQAKGRVLYAQIKGVAILGS